jgi:hypothetical protein
MRNTRAKDANNLFRNWPVGLPPGKITPLRRGWNAIHADSQARRAAAISERSHVACSPSTDLLLKILIAVPPWFDYGYFVV